LSQAAHGGNDSMNTMKSHRTSPQNGDIIRAFVESRKQKNPFPREIRSLILTAPLLTVPRLRAPRGAAATCVRLYRNLRYARLPLPRWAANSAALAISQRRYAVMPVQVRPCRSGRNRAPARPGQRTTDREHGTCKPCGLPGLRRFPDSTSRSGAILPPSGFSEAGQVCYHASSDPRCYA
jgi:hypothetical protein